MCRNGKVFEKDEYGIKVIQLANGDMLKFFRVKRIISSASVFSYARRFCRNAYRLTQRGFATVEVNKLYHLSAGRRSAVLYCPLAGDTLRDLIKAGKVHIELADRLGTLIAKLHQSGIKFRSIHTGNIIVLPNGELGLIDIADMSMFPWPLFCYTRQRNFRHLCRYREDVKALGQDFWGRFLLSYFSMSKLNPECELKLRNLINQLIAN
jgi:hypothetical protein